MTNADKEFESKAKEMEMKYEKKFNELRNQLNTKQE